MINTNNKNYKELYLKYKKKYLKFKKKLKGGNYGKIFFNSRDFIYKNDELNNTHNMMLYGDIKNIDEKGANLENNYLNWVTWYNVITKTIENYEIDVPYNSNNNQFDNKTIYSLNKYKLFPTESFLNSRFMEDLALKYKNMFEDDSNWYDDRPNYDVRQDYHFVFVEKLKFIEDSKVCIIGDIHSSLHSFLDILFKIKDDYFENSDDLKLKPNRYIIFLGDIVDRGPYSLELLLLIFGLKNKHFDQVFIINGNHEEFPQYSTNELYNRYGLQEEYDKQFEDKSKSIHILDSKIHDIFTCLPSCIYLQVKDKFYHFSHGAFDPDFAGINKNQNVSNLEMSGGNIIKPKPIRKSRRYSEEEMNQIQKIMDSREESKAPEIKEIKLENKLAQFLRSDKRFRLVQIDSIDNTNNNYKWGDFDNRVKWTSASERSDDGEILNFGIDITKKYIQENNLICLITGHQDQAPISLLLENSKTEDKPEFIIGSQVGYLDYEESPIYNLHVPNFDKYKKDNVNTYSIMEEGVSYHDNQIKFNPQSFLVLITSTATIPRDLANEEVFLELIL